MLRKLLSSRGSVKSVLLVAVIVFTLVVAVRPSSVAFACGEGGGSTCSCPGC